MYIIQKEASADGCFRVFQSWHKPTLPKGCVWCPEEFRAVYCELAPAGFVKITVENDVVVSMETDQAAYDAYIAENPPADPETEPETEPTVWDELDAAYTEGVNSAYDQ